MNCPNCGHPLAPNVKFCPKCGTPVVTGSFSDAKTQIMEDVPPTQEYIPQEPQGYDQTRYYDPQHMQQDEPPQDYGDSYQQQAPQNYDYPPQYQPPQSENYDRQFRDYQKPSPYGASHPSMPNGMDDMDKKKNMPLIIIIIVLAVLLVGGAIFTIIMMVNNNSKNNPPTNPTSGASVTSPAKQSSQNPASAQSSKPESSKQESSQQESSKPESSKQEQTSAQSSREESSAAESSQQSSEPEPYTGSTEITSPQGNVIASDPSIHADDKEAEKKLNDYLQMTDVEETEKSLENTAYSADIYAQGNAIVYEFDLKMDFSDAQKETIKKTLTTMQSGLSSSVKSIRTVSGVSDMVIVIAYVDTDGKPVGSAICK